MAPHGVTTPPTHKHIFRHVCDDKLHGPNTATIGTAGEEVSGVLLIGSACASTNTLALTPRVRFKIQKKNIRVQEQ